MQNTAAFYNELSGEYGLPAEDARFVLPNACATEITCTMNLRELIHFCNERLCSRAQWEIRDMARLMANAVIDVMPEAKIMLVPKCEKNAKYPYCTESQCCGRHKKLKEVYQTEENDAKS